MFHSATDIPSALVHSLNDAAQLLSSSLGMPANESDVTEPTDWLPTASNTFSLVPSLRRRHCGGKRELEQFAADP